MTISKIFSQKRLNFWYFKLTKTSAVGVFEFKNLKIGDKLQLERKGNFIVHFVGELVNDMLGYKTGDRIIKLISIPDGKKKKLASKSDLASGEMKAKKKKK
eukprot:NODE_89_length_21810_cov_0.170098.p17 type:complete len:101 gc:universal NODE_89_length_21810_cov_0.170098:14708-14406(-)